MQQRLFQFEPFSTFGLRRGMGGQPSHLKEKRFLPTKQKLHLILKSDRALGDWSFLRRARDIEALIRKVAKDNHVNVSDIANSGDHIHCLIQIHSRRTYFRFIRSLTGLLARLTTGAKRGSKLLEGFWTQKPFTQAISWGRELKGLHRYFQLNRLEKACSLNRPKARLLMVNLAMDLTPV